MSVNRIHPTLKHPVTGLPLEAVGIVGGKAIWPILGGAPDDGGDGGNGGDGKGAGGDGKAGATDKVFTQAELEAKITERLNRERDTLRSKYGDLEALKAKAEGNKTVEEQLATVQAELAQTRLDALRARLQASHGISDEDAEVFLVGTDEDTLKKQAERLKARNEELTKKVGGHVRGEGRNGRPTVTDEKQAVRTLFG